MGAPILFLTTGIHEQLRLALRLNPRRETCGFLIGSETGNVTKALDWLPASNLATAEGNVAVDAGEERYAQRMAQTRGLQLVGFGHSHVSLPLVFSHTDLAICRTRPYVWLLFGGRESRLELIAARLIAGCLTTVSVNTLTETK